MSVATLSIQGQITIPSTARRAVGLKAHDRVLIETRGGEIVIRPTAAFMELEGFLGRSLSPAEEKNAMARRIASHARRRLGSFCRRRSYEESYHFRHSVTCNRFRGDEP